MALKAAAFVDGREYAAEDVRRLAFAATDGATGVVRSGDLAVAATSTPSTNVTINAGVGYIQSTFAHAQAYVVSNDAAYSAPVPANGTGSPITLYVQLVIDDPQYPGTAIPPSPLTALYCRLLIQTTLLTDRPVLLLATIVVPASTSVITNAMITTRALVARPRSYREPHVTYPSGDTNMSKTAYVSWPLSDFAVNVPIWATKVYMTVMFNGVEYTGTDTGVAGVRAMFRSVAAQNGIIQSLNRSRQTLAVLGVWDVPEVARGTLCYLGVQAYQTSGAGNFQLDYQSQIIYDYDFRDQ